MKKYFKTSLLIIVLCIASTFSRVLAQTEKQESAWRHHIGSSLFMGFNLLPDPADYYLLSYGYYFSQKDVFIVEAWTWTVYEPIGTYGDSETPYPGKITSYGIGAGYQRFHWKNLYTTIEATPLVQQYYDSDDNKIQKGLQLYCQFIAGYRFELYNKRMFIEPAVALKYWPIDTNYPESFAEIEEGTPNHIFEPSLIFGFRF
jgi:hypothetical protein